MSTATTTTTATATKTSATDTVEAGSNSNSNSETESSSPPARNHPIAAVAQLRSTSDKFRNLVDIATCAGLAKSEGASMLFLPECFGFMGESAAQTLREAEDPARLEDAKAKAETHKGEIESETETENSPLARILATTIANASSRGGTNCDGASPSVGGDHEAEAVDVDVDSLMDGLRIIARESGLWISGGGMHVAGAPPPPPPPTYDGDNGSGEGEGEDGTPERVYNTHVVVDSDGRLRASYRKIHLFDVSIPGRVELRESRTTAPGTELVVCRDSPLGTLGVTTCYDLRFPETYTRLVTDSDMGARILLVPSAFTVPTGAAHWHALLRARAIENQCYVIAAAQYGKHNHKRESFGHSLIVDPWGKILADAGGYPTTEDEDTGRRHDPAAVPEPPSIVTAEIDLSLIDSIRERMPIDLHRSNATF